MEDNTELINKRVTQIEDTYEKDLDERAMQDLKQRENCIKIRGLKEKENEDLFEYLTPILAEYLGAETNQFQQEINKMYRINSKIAKQRKLPRDIVVYFTRKKIRDEIIQLNYEEKLEVDGKELLIYKDIPLRLLKKRNEYRPLVNLLKLNNINYRWEKLEGVVFRYKLELFKINSIMKMKDFLKKNKRELEKRGNNIQTEGKGIEKSEREMPNPTIHKELLKDIDSEETEEEDKGKEGEEEEEESEEATGVQE